MYARDFIRMTVANHFNVDVAKCTLYEFHDDDGFVVMCRRDIIENDFINNVAHTRHSDGTSMIYVDITRNDGDEIAFYQMSFMHGIHEQEPFLIVDVSKRAFDD